MARYLRPTRLEDVLAALATGPCRVIAGGTDHFPALVAPMASIAPLAAGPAEGREPDADLIDITALPGLGAVVRSGDTWRIPALASWTRVVETDLPPLFEGLKQAALQVGGRQIQNAGTLLGNVCNASPAADGVPALLALDAAVELQSVRGTRVVGLSEFVLGPRRTARRADELATALLIPNRDAVSRFDKLGGRRYLVISVTMVATTLSFDDAGRIAHAAVAVGACGPRAVRLSALEAAVIGAYPGDDLVRMEHLASLAPIDDLRAPAAYRQEATLELVRRALGGMTGMTGQPGPARKAA